MDDEVLTDFVRERAGHCCEYCLLPQACSPEPFQIDHIIAEQHGGSTRASNLALACLADNNHKGPNLAGIDPRQAGECGCTILGVKSGRAIFAGKALSSLAARQ